LFRANPVRPLVRISARLLASGLWSLLFALPLLSCALALLPFFVCPPALNILFSQHGPLDRPGALDSFRHRRLAHDVAYRLGCETSASGFGYHIDFRAFVNDHTTASATEIAVFAADIINDASAIDDGRVVYNNRVGTNAIMKMMHVNEHEERWRQNRAARSARRPSNVIGRFSPGYPRWRPFSAGNPAPTIAWIIHPGTVVITSP
jgi:hypothetical protein